jgi:Tol biopolymer transport system component
LFCQKIEFLSKPEIFLPGIVSTEKSEVKITFSKEGTIALWGVINWEGGPGGWDIYQTIKTGKEWSKPQLVSFNSASNDFDPCFSADGKGVYFFSNRPGGIGGDDLYFVSYDPDKNTYGEPINLGAEINTKGDEWGPTVSPDGTKFLYCTDGAGGSGKHDVFICDIKDGKLGARKNLAELNFQEDDFDPTFLHDNKTIVFSRKTIDKDEVLLYVSFIVDGKYTKPELLGTNINALDSWNFGSSVDPSIKNLLYYTSHIPGNNKGRVDIYSIKYKLTK